VVEIHNIGICLGTWIRRKKTYAEIEVDHSVFFKR